jgi:adenylate cyclase class 2
MQTEIEAKFLHMNHDEVRKVLQGIGAERMQPMRLMRRNNFDFPDHRLQKQRNGWVRVRNEGDKITVSYKELGERTIHGMKEVCVTVDNYEAATQLLEALGLTSNAYQETRRESWQLGDVQIELDEWPWLDPFIEIEGPSEQAVRDAAKKMSLDYTSATFGSVEAIYQDEYDVTDDDIWALTTMTFDEPVPALFKRWKV